MRPMGFDRRTSRRMLQAGHNPALGGGGFTRPAWSVSRFRSAVAYSCSATSSTSTWLTRRFPSSEPDT
jgi:hypothetical protein